MPRPQLLKAAALNARRCRSQSLMRQISRRRSSICRINNGGVMFVCGLNTKNGLKLGKFFRSMLQRDVFSLLSETAI